MTSFCIVLLLHRRIHHRWYQLLILFMHLCWPKHLPLLDLTNLLPKPLIFQLHCLLHLCMHLTPILQCVGRAPNLAFRNLGPLSLVIVLSVALLFMRTWDMRLLRKWFQSYKRAIIASVLPRKLFAHACLNAVFVDRRRRCIAARIIRLVRRRYRIFCLVKRSSLMTMTTVCAAGSLIVDMPDRLLMMLRVILFLCMLSR